MLVWKEREIDNHNVLENDLSVHGSDSAGETLRVDGLMEQGRVVRKRL